MGGHPLELCGPTALGRTHPREPRKETDTNGCLKEPQTVEGEVCQGGPHGEDREPGPAGGMEVAAGQTHRACCRCMSSKPRQTLLGRPAVTGALLPWPGVARLVSRNRERQAAEPRVTLPCPVRNPLALCPLRLSEVPWVKHADPCPFQPCLPLVLVGRPGEEGWAEREVATPPPTRGAGVQGSIHAHL